MVLFEYRCPCVPKILRIASGKETRFLWVLIEPRPFIRSGEKSKEIADLNNQLLHRYSILYIQLYVRWVNPFIFIRNKCCVMSSEGSQPLKKTPLYVLRGLCCTSSRVQQPTANSSVYLAHFFEFEHAGSSVGARCRL